MIESDLKLVLMGCMMKPHEDLLDIFAFLMCCLGGKMDMGRVVTDMDWQTGDSCYLCDSWCFCRTRITRI